MNRLPNKELEAGHKEVHFLFTESRYLFWGQIFVQVLFVVYEKYPDGHWVTHFLVYGFEKYPVVQISVHVPHWVVPAVKNANCFLEHEFTHIRVNESA